MKDTRVEMSFCAIRLIELAEDHYRVRGPDGAHYFEGTGKDTVTFWREFKKAVVSERG